MKEIPLTRGLVAIVDDDDYERFGMLKWQASAMRDRFYASGNIPIPGVRGGYTRQSLHRAIMSAPKGLVVDHKNGNSLDNRKENLRICTHAQNQSNKQKMRESKSGIRGVTPNGKRWTAYIGVNKKTIYLGSYSSKLAAAAVYAAANRHYFGEFGGRLA